MTEEDRIREYAAAPPPVAPGPSVFRCTECGHGGNLRAWAHVNIHGDLARDGHVEWPDDDDDAFWPVIEESVACKLHGEDHVEKLVNGQYTSYIDTATGRFTQCGHGDLRAWWAHVSIHGDRARCGELNESG